MVDSEVPFSSVLDLVSTCLSFPHKSLLLSHPQSEFARKREFKRGNNENDICDAHLFFFQSGDVLLKFEPSQPSRP